MRVVQWKRMKRKTMVLCACLFTVFYWFILADYSNQNLDQTDIPATIAQIQIDPVEALKDQGVKILNSTDLEKYLAQVTLEGLRIRTSLDMQNLTVVNGTHDGDVKVPKILHQSWNDQDIPKMTVKWVKKWREIHPNWTYIFWTDQSSRDFIRRYFPEYLALYDWFKLPVQKADLFRYFVLFSIGGVYADLDVEPLRSLDTMLEKPCVLGQEPEAHFRLLHPYFGTPENNYTLSCNAFMFCRPRHPFMAYLISRIVEYTKNNKECILPNTLFCTGPYILSTTWVLYKAQYDKLNQSDPANDVTCPEADTFLPTWDPLRTGWIKLICLRKKHYDKLTDYSKRLCERLKREKFSNNPKSWSYTNHHWFHSWTAERKRYLPKKYHKEKISQVMPKVIFGDKLIAQEKLR